MAKEAPTGLKAFVDLDDIIGLPRTFLDTFKPSSWLTLKYPIWRRGDNDAFFALWADNLATQLSIIALITGLPGTPPEFVFKNCMPGVGISLLFGNLYYGFQASRVAMKTGDMSVTAQPYGINTPGAFAKIFGIWFAVYFNADPTKGYGIQFGAAGPTNGLETAEKAWKIACACNFISGLIEVCGSFLAPVISAVVPTTAILAPIAGIGLAWLHFNHFIDAFHYPLEFFMPFIIVWIAYIGGVKSRYGPVAILSVIVGCIMCWITGYNTKEKLDDAADIVKGYSGAFGVCFEEMGEVGDFINILIPIALTSAIGTLMCVRSAQREGDVYSPMETMLVDGVGTMIGALFGSPLGTTVYIGHPAYKKMGASRGYSMLNGIVYFIMGFTGLHAFLDGLLGKISVYPIICFVGLYIGDQICRITPPRWYAAMLLGVLITFSDWGVTSFSGGNPMSALPALGFMKEGYLFLTVIWTWAFCMLTDRKFWQAALIFIAGMCLSFVGLIHSKVVAISYDDKGTINDGIPAASAEIPELEPGLPGWRFILGYLLAAVLCGLLFALQMAKLIDPPVEEPYEVEVGPEFPKVDEKKSDDPEVAATNVEKETPEEI